MTTTLNIRGIDAEAADRAKRRAAVRGLTLGRYFERLVALHDAIRERADAGDVVLQDELTELGLETRQG